MKFHVECRQNHVWGPIFDLSYDHICKCDHFGINSDTHTQACGGGGGGGGGGGRGGGGGMVAAPTPTPPRAAAVTTATAATTATTTAATAAATTTATTARLCVCLRLWRCVSESSQGFW